MVILLDVVTPVLHLAVACGPAVDPALTRAIIQVESRGAPYAIGNNTLRQSVALATATEAAALATQWWQQQHSLDLGLMQVNSAWLTRYGVSVRELFDPCTNIRIGTAIYAANIQHCQQVYPGLDTTTCALSFYHRGHPTAATAYATAVMRLVRAEGNPTLRISSPLGPPAAAQRSTHLQPNTPLPDRLFVPVGALPPSLQGTPETARCVLFGCSRRTAAGVFLDGARDGLFPAATGQ